MSEKLIQSITEQLNEEKWTRAALNNYTVNHFTDLDELIAQVNEAKVEDEVEKLCEEHLQHTKNSIISLYISGILHLRKQSINDSHILSLVSLFAENHRWKLVEHLCLRILDFGENKHALRHLADSLVNSGRQDEVFPVWERLIRVDYEEADITRRLAEHAEAEENLESAVDFYKKGLHRYINKKMFSQTVEIWRKLIDLVPDEVEFYYHAESKVAKSMPVERSIQLLEEIYPHFKDESKWDTAIDILKRILGYDSKNAWARKEIVECYTRKYEAHSQLEEYIKLSNLTQSWRDVHEAIQDFEKHISFDDGNFVFHRHWGVGRIKSIKADEITVNFLKKKAHKMSLKMAVNSLTILGRDHIWVYRLTKSKEALNKKVKKDIVWSLKTIIRSFDNAADMKKIKAELVPYILSANEWSTWSTKARAELKTNEIFGNLPDDPDTYVVRDKPISFTEKTYTRFKAEKDFDNRVKIVQEFLNHLDYSEDLNEGDVDSDLFREMFEYFLGYIRNINTVNEHTLVAFLLVGRMTRVFPFLNAGLSYTFRDLFEAVENASEVFAKIDNPEIRRDFLLEVKRHVKSWTEVYLELIPYYLQKEPVADLLREGKKAELVEKFLSLFNNYKDQREAFIWFVRTFFDDKWFREIDLSEEKLLISLLHLLDITAREIDNRKDVSLNRKLNKQVETFLFKDGTISRYIEHGDEESISRIFSLIEDVKDLDPRVVITSRQEIVKRFPEFRFYGETTDLQSVSTVSRGGFFTLAKSFEEKQRSLSHLLEVEVPKNSKEIGAAREYGDLKENAEYKAAKERQDMLNTTAARWKDELERAQIVRPEDISPDKVGFGIRVSLKNLLTGEDESFIILGPWESNPEKSILSHQSPFAAELMHKKLGDEFSFTINERDYSYKVKSLSVADLDNIEPVPSTI